MIMRKRILLIGANGFTGRRILNDLSHNLSYQVTGSSMHDDCCPGSGNYHYIQADICNVQTLKELFKVSIR